MANTVKRGTGNVFRDLGFASKEAENLRLRADLMMALTRIMQSRGLTQTATAKLLGVSQPRVSDLVRGKIDRFSVDALVAMLGAAGMEVRVTTRQRRVA